MGKIKSTVNINSKAIFSYFRNLIASINTTYAIAAFVVVFNLLQSRAFRNSFTQYFVEGTRDRQSAMTLIAQVLIAIVIVYSNSFFLHRSQSEEFCIYLDVEDEEKLISLIMDHGFEYGISSDVIKKIKGVRL